MSNRFEVAKGLRCKPGDMAMVVVPLYCFCNDTKRKLVAVPIGTVVTVTKYVGDHSSQGLVSTSAIGLWELEIPIPVCIEFASGTLRTEISGISDGHLMPIRPKDGFKEDDVDTSLPGLVEAMNRQTVKLNSLLEENANKANS